MKFKFTLATLLLALTIWGGCTNTQTVSLQQEAAANAKAAATTPTPQQSPRPYSKDMKELHASFNRDKGKVRLVTLLSPT